MKIASRFRRTAASALLTAGLAYPACAAVCPKGIGGLSGSRQVLPLYRCGHKLVLRLYFVDRFTGTGCAAITGANSSSDHCNTLRFFSRGLCHDKPCPPHGNHDHSSSERITRGNF